MGTVDGQSITGEKIARQSIDFSHTKYFKTGKNKFNKLTATVDKYIVGATGVMSTNTSYYASDYIPVLTGEQYYIPSAYHFAFYDKNKVYIIGYSDAQTNPITIPANAFYVRTSIPKANINTYQIELGTAATSYEAYVEYVDTTYIKDKTITGNMLNENTIPLNKVSFVKNSKNLFNKVTVTSGYYVSYATGNLSVSASYIASDYIPVTPSTQYTRGYNHQMAFYDINKVYISGLNTGLTFTTPATCYFIRVTMTPAVLDTMQVELGASQTPFVSYKYYIDYLDTNNDVMAFLPSEICIAVGRTIELYNSQVVWCGNINNYHIKWECTVGKAYKRKWSYTGVLAKIGTYPLTLTVYDNNMKVITSATTTVRVVSNVIENPVNLLTIGDSLTNNKPWSQELRTLSTDKITMVGSRGTAPLKHEGRSGFTAAQYLAATAYSFESEGVHPFWDGSRFNYSYYKTNTGVTPDAVQIFLGTNGIALDPTVNGNAIKQIVDYIRQDDATIPIFLVFTLYRGNQDGIGNQLSSDGYSAGSGVWKLEEDRKVFNLMQYLYSLLSGYANLNFVPIALAHDSEYNFGAVSTAVNPRAAQTELLPTEATHPQTQGYYQFADIMYSTMCKVF